MNISPLSVLIALLLFIGRLWAEYDPVAVYLTWQRDPTSTMTVQWVSELGRSEDLVEYQRPGEACWQRVEGAHAAMPEKYRYLIHRAEISGLKPDSLYRFRTGAEGKIYSFRTMPATLERPIRFIVGGDIYHDSMELLGKMNSRVASLEPMFMLLGGDIAYNKLGPNRYRKMPRWLEWLICCKQQMVTPSGRLIPMIPAIGNHDVKGGFDQPIDKAPFFYSLFAMPGPAGCNVLDFSHYLSLLILDSGHTHPIEGAQAQWLQEALQRRSQVPHKIALYHVPAYPSVRPFNEVHCAKIRRAWVPLFEEFGLDIAFENHDHAYKRSWPIRNGKRDPEGVLYIGDGGYAVEKPRTPHPCWYLAHSAASRNFVLVILHEEERHLLAMDETGKILDEIYIRAASRCGRQGEQSAHTR